MVPARSFSVLAPGERTDRLVASADLGAAAGEVDIGAAQALADIDGRQADRLQPVGIERDQDLALDAADAFDLARRRARPAARA